MCILVEGEDGSEYGLSVHHTDIFARHTGPGLQVLAYRLSISAHSEAAMILPLPVAPGSGENAVRFIDLSGFRDFFQRLADVCEPEFLIASLGSTDFEEAVDEALSPLEVHEVGDFVASFVPSLADFDRLDRRFRLSPEVWSKLPEYADYGFAVFQLKVKLSAADQQVQNDVQPMALEFPTRDSQRLFYPTVHVHDGSYHPHAEFKHCLYSQRDDARAAFMEAMGELCEEEMFLALKQEAPDDPLFWFYRSTQPAGVCLEVERSAGLLDAEGKLYCMHLFGSYANRDVWVGAA